MGQNNPNKGSISVRLSHELIAKARTYVSGKTIPNYQVGSRGIRKATRKMNVSDLMVRLVTEFLEAEHIVPSVEDVAWMERQRASAKKRRAEADIAVAMGVNRKPLDQLKRKVHDPARLSLARPESTGDISHILAIGDYGHHKKPEHLLLRHRKPKV